MDRLDLISNVLLKIDEIKLIELVGKQLEMEFVELEITDKDKSTLENFLKYLWSYNKNEQYEAIRRTNEELDVKCYSSMSTPLVDSLLEILEIIINNEPTKFQLEVYDLNNFTVYCDNEYDRDYLRESLFMLFPN